MTAGDQPEARLSSSERLKQFFSAFSDLRRLSAGFWIVLAAFVFETTAYFGALTLMTSYLTRDMGWATGWASLTVSFFTAVVTLFMLGAGSYAERFGLRRAIIAALLLCVVGRILYAYAPGLTGGAAPPAGTVMLGAVTILAALLVIALGEAILQPVCYSGIKQYTDEKTSAMGYALIYAVMNAGIAVVGELSARFRPAVQSVLDGQPSGQIGLLDSFARWLAARVGSGIQAVNWICAAISGLTLLGFAFCMTRRIESRKLRPDVIDTAAPRHGAWERFVRFFADGPFSDARFMFFIFMLLPVRTLFAHQWLTMPEFILRAYDKPVADNMERLVNWINPLIIFFGVPIATALTRRVNVYTMMMIGSLVSAAPTFLLCGGTSFWLLIAYFVIFSVGEALWTARFLEYASELAPPGRIAQYMGLANIPWLLAKFTTGIYAGTLLDRYVPSETPAAQQSGTLWLIYGCIAMTSPIGLWLGRKWVRAGMQQAPARA